MENLGNENDSDIDAPEAWVGGCEVIARTPHVTGVAALVASEGPQFEYKDIRDAILNGADKVPSLDGLGANSARLDANGAVSQRLLLQI